jgi:hypothetical protein
MATLLEQMRAEECRLVNEWNKLEARLAELRKWMWLEQDFDATRAKQGLQEGSVVALVNKES